VYTLRIIVEIAHPAQVHLFKNMIWQLERKGHSVRIAAANKEVTLDLLKSYGFGYDVLYNNTGGSLLKKSVMLINGQIRMFKLASEFRPDLFISTASEISGPVSRIFKKPHIGVTDTEHAGMTNAIAYPTTDVILTPACFKNDLGNKQVRFDGCKELAYLHPDYFKPDPSVLPDLGLSERDNIFSVRFAAFHATHDARSEKFSSEYIPMMIDRLRKEGEICISSEVSLDSSLKKYQHKLSPDKFQSLLYYSKLYIGEGSSSANEAAILGVPSLHFERLRDGDRAYGVTEINGIMSELQDLYGLVYTFHEEEKLLEKLDEILSDPGKSKKEWMGKREKFIRDKIDVTSFLVWFTENYPDSYREIKDNPALQHRFVSGKKTMPVTVTQ
jgi:predicted glycosyltransferase